MLSQTPNQSIKNGPQQQQAKAAAPATFTQLPTGTSHSQSTTCPGTHQAKYDCNTVSAIANVRQADAAEWFNHLAYAEIGIGFFTALVAALAARWAKSAADAGRRANKISKDTAKRQLRAYMSFAGVEPIPVPLNDNPITAWTFKYVWINSGQTPATNIVITSGAALGPIELPEEYRYGATDQAAGRTCAGPGITIFGEIKITTAQLTNAISRGHNIFLYSSADYVDAFGKNRRTESCHQLFPHANPLERTIWFTTANRGPFNGMDDGCMRPPQQP